MMVCAAMLVWFRPPGVTMKSFLLSTALICAIALPAAAQVAAPAGPEAAPSTNAAIAHHDRKVAHKAARHGNMRKAAVASHAADAAATDASVPH
jgi:hypothetical protein